MSDHGATRIAIVGMAGRFPGAPNLARFWENLAGGVEAVVPFTDEDLERAGVEPALARDPAYVRSGPVLENIGDFDAELFGITPWEARLMDPQHRFFLECVWEAFEHAGHDPKRFDGVIGVFAGCGLNSYLLSNIVTHRERLDPVTIFQTAITNGSDYLPTRVSHVLGLRGPSINVQTACSTSLVAVHLAMQALLTYECDMAVAGGVSIQVPQKAGYLYQEGLIFSRDGHCRAFDAEASGTVVGDGVGAVLLKRLDDAVADGDHIHAVILGSALNNDGSSKSDFTSTSVEGQSEVVARAIAVAGISPETISYVEAHGTGTRVGDPIEIAALTRAFASLDGSERIAVGTVKTNVGHLLAAAGMAGLIKTVLALEHRKMPASLNLARPNPDLHLEEGPFFVNTELSDWAPRAGVRRAGVSSFGIGGTNAHLVVEEYDRAAASGPSRAWYILTLSAHREDALEELTGRLRDDLSERGDTPFADIAYTLQIGRPELECRRMFVCQDPNSAVASIDRASVHPDRSSGGGRVVQPAFMFTGQGSQYVNMAADIYRQESSFRRTMDMSAAILEPILGEDLRRIVFSDDAASEQTVQRLQQTQFTQPALFAIEYSVARLLMSWGVEPDAMIGHSVGEFVAGCLAGVFSLEAALELVALRGQLMQDLPPGAMMAVPLDEADARSVLDDDLSLAAANSTGLSVISGPSDAVDRLEQRLTARGLHVTRLRTSHAFHSLMMEPAVKPFLEHVRRHHLGPPRIPLVSSVTGDWLTDDEATDPSYWAEHLRNPVRFGAAVSRLLSEPERPLVEIGPGETLKSLTRRNSNCAPEQVVVHTIPHPRDPRPGMQIVLEAIGRLWMSGVAVDWKGFHDGEQRARVPVPSYPFQRRHYWVDRRERSLQSEQSGRKMVDDRFYEPAWKRAPLPSSKAEEATRGLNWMVVLDNHGVGDEFCRALVNDGACVVAVRLVGQRAGLSRIEGTGGYDEYLLPGDGFQDFDGLLDQLAQDDKAPDRVASLVSLAPANSEERLSGFYSLLALVQGLGNRLPDRKTALYIIADNAHEVIGGDIHNPESAVLMGAYRVVPLEYVSVSTKLVDLDLEEHSLVEPRLLAQLLFRELTGTDSRGVIAYRRGRRWEQLYAPVNLPDSKGLPERLRKNGTYLITGGLGGLGGEIARYLAQSVQAKLVLTGRSTLNTTDEEGGHTSRIRELEALGAEVLYCVADVSDMGEMKSAVRAASSRFGPINGVVHAAGIPGGQLIALKEAESVAAVLAPKVAGTRVLHELLGHSTLDFFVLFSSVAAVRPIVGQVDYCGANAFLDAFAACLSTDSSPIQSIAWETWRDVGMAANAAVPAGLEHLRQEALRDALSTQEGINVFDRALRTDLPNIVVSTSGLVDRVPAEVLTSVMTEKRHGATSPAGGADAPTSAMEGRVIDLWCDVMGMESVGRNDNFFELGGHSLLAAQLIARVREAFGASLSIRVIFESPTPAELAERISQLLSEGVGGGS